MTKKAKKPPPKPPGPVRIGWQFAMCAALWVEALWAVGLSKAALDLGAATVAGVLVCRAAVNWRKAGRASKPAGPPPAAAPAAVVSSPALRAALTAYFRGPVELTTGDGWVRCAYPPETPDWQDAFCVEATGVVTAKTGRRHRAEWDRAANVVQWWQRPDMPTDLPRPASADPDRLGIGGAEDGQRLVWNLTRTPHCLVGGETGYGKTELVIGMAAEAAAAGCRVWACDPKMFELNPLRGLPGVERIAKTPADMAQLVVDAHAEMMERCRRVDEDGEDPASFPRLLVVIEELRVFVPALNTFWRSQSTKGVEHPSVELWRQATMMGRAIRVNWLVATQQPQAKIFGGTDTRDQYGMCVGVGRFNQEGAKTLFGEASIGRDVPDVPGRATVRVGGAFVEVQCYRAGVRAVTLS